MITLDELKAFLARWNLYLDDISLQCIVEIVNEYYQCLIDNGASECKAKMALLTAASILIWGDSALITTAKNFDGLSQSWDAQDISDIQDGLRSNLSIYDPTGCLSPVIPSNPTAKTFFGVVSGSSC